MWSFNSVICIEQPLQLEAKVLSCISQLTSRTESKGTLEVLPHRHVRRESKHHDSTADEEKALVMFRACVQYSENAATIEQESE